MFPDGIITPLWITKHQNRLPAVFIAFFALTVDPNTSSLCDNKIKTEIGNIRGVFSSTNYKTKVVVILVGQPNADTLPDVDERLGSIRKATGLDSRHLFFLQPEASTGTVKEFVKVILTSLQPFCVEYYRDLSKHTRRKRNRSSIPPPTTPPTFGTSQTLSLQGWNVRYEFKLGVFAEFRQEMDAACRNYESAYEGLFSHEVFETISSWSPRFNEARLLADTIAIRILRCLLWTERPTSAARFWNRHRNWTRDLVNRRGKGSENYGWEAWETIWSKSFAQLLASTRSSEMSASESTHSAGQQVRTQFSQPEKSIPVGERIAPWELLHHEGYWFNRAWKHTRNRRELVHQMPEEDRTSPGQSPASAIANRSHLYDTYLALEPHLEYPLGDIGGYDYSHEILDNIQSTIHSFSKHGQTRFVEKLQLEKAREYLRGEKWHDAVRTMGLIWPCLSWRQAGWWKLVAEAARTFRKAAKQIKDAENLLRLEWEAHSSRMPVSPEWKYDLQGCLEEIEAQSTKPSVVIASEDSLSPIGVSLHFAATEGNVGEPLKAQLALLSTAHKESQPITLSEVKILFEGGLRSVRILSGETETSGQANPVLISKVHLHEPPSSTDDHNSPSMTSGLASLVGTADMKMLPGQGKVFDLTFTPREAGEVKVASLSLICETNAFSLTHIINQPVMSDTLWWSFEGGEPHCRPLARDIDVNSVKVLPKPPKVRIDLPNLKRVYYTNEKVSLAVVIRNEELEAADVSLEAKLLSPSKHTATIQWEDTADSDSFDLESKQSIAASKDLLSLPRRPLGSVPSAGSYAMTFLIEHSLEPIQHELEIAVYYYLLSDPEATLTRTVVVDIRISRPFEANYELLPRHDSEPWPNFFDPATTSVGMNQQFLLLSKIACFVTEPVTVENVNLSAQDIMGNAVCEFGKEKHLNMGPESAEADAASRTLAPQETRESSFEVLIRKNALGDPHSVAVDFILTIEWRRSVEENVIVSTLEVPRYLIPMAEPRVLLSKRQDTNAHQPGLIHVEYTIENPSMHYLTFNLIMESSDEFAFSGPKATSFSLVPVSRRSVDYRILARQGGKWVRISLGVQDTYFSKALRVIPASEGIRSDGKRGLLVWVEQD